MIPNEPPGIIEIEGIKFATPEPVAFLLKAVSEERDDLNAENEKLIAEVAGMRDKWTPPNEVAQLITENEALKTELRGERERLLIDMYNNDTISQVQFDHAIIELDLLAEVAYRDLATKAKGE